MLFLGACRTPDTGGAVEALVAASDERVETRLDLKVETIETELPVQKNEPYKLGPNDVLQVNVVGHPEFSGLGRAPGGEIVGVRVQPDGKIYLPLLEGVQAGGRTTVELQDDIHERLLKYLKKPHVTVDVLRFESQRFYVLGAVRKPGVFPVDGRTSLLAGIGQAGGVLPDGNLDAAYVIRDKKLLPISLGDLLLRGDTSRNIALVDGDFIYVPLATELKVYVLGDVNRPRAVPIPRTGLTLAGAIAEAGGFNLLYASKKKVRIFRGGWQRPEAYTLNAEDIYKYGESIRLRPGDRIMIGPKGLATWNRAVTLLLPFLQLPTTGVGLAAAAN